MGNLYDSILNNRGLIEKRVAEKCRKEQYLKKDCSIINLLISLVFELFSNGNYLRKAEEYFCLKHFSNQDKVKQIQSLMANGNDYKVFIVILKHIKEVIEDMVFAEIKENSELYNCIMEADNCFYLLQLALYNEWDKVQNTDAIIKRIFELTPFGIFIFEENKLIHVNTVGEKLLGYSNTELMNMSFNDFMHPDFHYINRENIKSWEEDKKIINNRFDCKIVNKSGLEVWVDISVGLEELNGKTCIIATVLDITARKNIDELRRQTYESTKLLNEALEYDKIKTEFFSNLSHELRTPLNVILGALQLMDLFYENTLDASSEKVKRYCRLIRQNCYRLLRLVNNLIDLNKLDTGYMNINLNNHDIVSIVSMIASSVTDYIENQGIKFNFDTKINTRVIACDPDNIERIILNLLSNSIKFTDNGGMIKITIWDNEDSLFIAVKDTGIGIPKEKQDLIFNRFVQVDKSMSRNHQGSGIGLSIVKSLVELQGGNIKMISEAGEGCEFIIELPAKQIVSVGASSQKKHYDINNRIEVINIEFADIYLK